MTVVASLLVAVVSALGCGGGGTHGAGVTSGTGGATGTGGNTSPPTSSIAITGVDAPAMPAGDVILTVHLAHADLATATVAVTVSANGAAFTAAHADSSAAVSTPGADGEGTVVLVWHSLEDVSLHGTQAVTLRFVPTDTHGAGAAFDASLTISNVHMAARRVNFPLFSYGAWNAASIVSAKKHDLVVIHPSADGVNRALVQELQKGMDPNDPSDDIIVLGYVSIGEDDRVSALTDAQARADTRFRGDATGPRVDPRGPTPHGGSLSGLAVLGNASPGGTGWASFYLDDNSIARDGKADGIPDRNASFGGYFVNAGDPKWFDLVDGMTLDGVDGVAGLKEVLTTTTGRGLGCDGVFLDTIDTAAPNGWTTPSADDLSQFEWTAPGMSAFVGHVHSAYPGSLVLQNRGDFFFNPELQQFPYTTRGAIDFFLFESYRLSSSTSDGIDPLFFADNQYDIMPKLVAESQRPDGFRTLSLGYAEGTELMGAANTLVGNGSVALDSLLEDIRVTVRVAGFRHYLTNADLTLTNAFVRDHADLTDSAPPVWSSVWNQNVDASGLPAAPSARAGVQHVTPFTGGVTVQWDVAIDMNTVSYRLYYSTGPFDFTGDPHLTGAVRVTLTPHQPAAYASAFSKSTLPFEDMVTGLKSGTTYQFVLRAVDSDGNEDANTTVASALIP